MPGRRLQFFAATLLLASGLLISASIGKDGSPSANANVTAEFEQPEFSVILAAGEVRMKGATRSADHEAALIQLAEDHFDGLEPHADFVPALLLPPEWDAASSRLLYALAAADAGTATMDPQTIHIRAVSADADTLVARIGFLNESLGDDVKLITDIVEISAAVNFDDLCERAFENLAFEAVAFKESSTAIRDSSFATLDRLVEYANDCQDVMLTITGHTDASGDESWNQQLSRARAQAVADYMVVRGVAAERLKVDGRGSAQPIADNNSVIGRERNRRIEFELR